MSEWHVEVVKIGPVQKHPNADRLEMTMIHGGYPVIFQASEFKEGDLAVYVPVDSIVPATPEWAFLGPRDKDRRIRAKKLRGIFSMGILTSAPFGAAEGQSVAELLDIKKYEPDEENNVVHIARTRTQPKMTWWQRALRFFGLWRSNQEPQYGLRPPKLKHLPGYYDIEPFRKYGRTWFQVGEEVIVTEKIHGQNASFVHDGKKLHLKSRTRWRSDDATERQNTWAAVAKKYQLEARLSEYPGIILYGETYGNNSDMPYGVDRNAEGDRFVAFDAFDSKTGRWMQWDEFAAFCGKLNVPRVPVLQRFTWTDYSYEKVVDLAEGSTVLGGGHTREGFVIKPVSGRLMNGGQRIILKMHGEGFLTRKAA